MTDTVTSAAALTERRGNVLLITINRPEARNAVNSAVSTAVGDALREAQDDYDRTSAAAEVALSEERKAKVRALACDFPALWADPAKREEHEVHHDGGAAVGDERQRHSGERNHARRAALQQIEMAQDDRENAGEVHGAIHVRK